MCTPGQSILSTRSRSLKGGGGGKDIQMCRTPRCHRTFGSLVPPCQCSVVGPIWTCHRHNGAGGHVSASHREPTPSPGGDPSPGWMGITHMQPAAPGLHVCTRLRCCALLSLQGDLITPHVELICYIYFSCRGDFRGKRGATFFLSLLGRGRSETCDANKRRQVRSKFVGMRRRQRGSGETTQKRAWRDESLRILLESGLEFLFSTRALVSPPLPPLSLSSPFSFNSLSCVCNSGT